MAVKILKDDRQTDYVISLFRQEAEFLSRLNHQNIVKAHHLIKFDNKFYMGL
jgi:serine/threonine protein kinase